MHIVCIARHPILSEHIAALCVAAGGIGKTAVGADEGMRLARAISAHAVLCEVDLLVPEIMRAWEADAQLGGIPLLAVSLTRRQNEVPMLAGAPVAGYLYLPTLADSDLARALTAAARGVPSAPSGAYRWSTTGEPTPVA
jgi:DNA-binding NarL/FixJ family response regulator